MKDCSSVFCDKCGTECQNSDIYCRKCGNELNIPNKNDNFIYNVDCNTENDEIIDIETLLNVLLDLLEKNDFDINRKVKYILSSESNEKVRGEYIAWLKENDLLENNYYHSLKTYLEKQPSTFYNIISDIVSNDLKPKKENLINENKKNIYQKTSNNVKATIIKNKNCCPNCGSANYDIIDEVKYKTTVNLNPLKPFTLTNTKEVKKKKKKLSLGKVALGVATGGTSVLATGVNKKTGTNCRCRNCGHEWVKK